jgi:hypothetical protein
MQVAAVIPILIFFGTAMVVAVRLLLLSRRTRQLPEFSLGAGLVLMSVVGMPLAVLGRLPGTIGTPLGNAVFALGLSLVCIGVVMLFAFTSSVFHSENRSARNGLVAVALIMAALDLGLVHAASQGSTLAEIVPRTRPWAIGIVGMVVAAFAWTGFESLRYYRRLRRRRALGLADGVVTNRFLLWGIAGWTAVALCGSIVGFLLAGKAILIEPVALYTLALCGTVMSATWYLTFFPPAFYLRLIGGASHSGSAARPA